MLILRVERGGVIPAKAGIQEAKLVASAEQFWMPAYAGMTEPNFSKSRGPSVNLPPPFAVRRESFASA